MTKNPVNEYVFIYITAKDFSQAKKIGKALVQERLVACVNIVPAIKSMYWWEGKIQDDTESMIIAKSKKSLVKKLINRVKFIHSYKVPCIVALPILDGNPDFLKWIGDETLNISR